MQMPLAPCLDWGRLWYAVCRDLSHQLTVRGSERPEIQVNRTEKQTMTVFRRLTRRTGSVLATTAALVVCATGTAQANHISVSIQRLAASLDQQAISLAQDIQSHMALTPFGPRLSAHSAALCRATHHLFHTAFEGGTMPHLQVDLAEVIAAQRCLSNALSHSGACGTINRDMIQLVRTVSSLQIELNARAFSVPSSPYAYQSGFYVAPYPGRIMISVGGRLPPGGW